MTVFGTRLKTALDMRGMTAAELSRRTGISKGTISQYLNGIISPKPDKVYAISLVLNVSSNWLMAFEEEPEEDRVLSEEVRVLFNSLSTDRQKEALAYLQFLAQRETDTKDEELLPTP